MLILIASLAVGAVVFWFGLSTGKSLAARNVVEVSDTYTAPEKLQTPTQLYNACAVKIANEIRESGALKVVPLEGNTYRVTLRVVK